MKIEPAWIGAACSVILIITGLVKSYSAMGTRLVVLEGWRQFMDEWREGVDRDLKDGDRRLSAQEGFCHGCSTRMDAIERRAQEGKRHE